MPREIRTAVAAAALKGIRVRLVRGLTSAGVELLAMPEDGRSALDCLHHLRPELLIADQFLPELDGAALALRAAQLRLPLRPVVVLLADERMQPALTPLSEAGVSVLNRRADANALARVVAALRDAPLSFPARDELRAEALLDELGFPEHSGRDCLKLCALLCISDERCRYKLSATLYPKVAREMGMTSAQAQRAMRHAIELAWQSDKFENQERIFAGGVDARRGQPTLSEMISRLTDILRLEG